MTITESRETHSWQRAVNLGPALVTLAEALPSHEATGLVMQLHALMLELPAMIIRDLVLGGEARFDPIFRLAAALELIERIYPALDGAAARTALDALVDRLMGPSFNERLAPVTPGFPAIGADPVELPPEPVAEPLASEAQAAVDAAQAVPLQPVAATPAPSPVVPITVPLQTPQQDTTIYVQPNSGQ